MEKTIKSYVFEFLDDLPAGRISSWDITDAINLRTGRRTMPHQIKRYCKEYADIAGASFVCAVPEKSIDEYTPGYKIASARIVGVE